MSTIASCPRCSQHVSIPIDVAPTAIVRCPHCQVEYRLQEALSRIPPLLILVDAGLRGTSDSGIFGMPGLAEPDHRLPASNLGHEFETETLRPMHVVRPTSEEEVQIEPPTQVPAPPEEDQADADFVAFEADEVDLEMEPQDVEPQADVPRAGALHGAADLDLPPDPGDEIELSGELFEMPADDETGSAAESRDPAEADLNGFDMLEAAGHVPAHESGLDHPAEAEDAAEPDDLDELGATEQAGGHEPHSALDFGRAAEFEEVAEGEETHTFGATPEFDEAAEFDHVPDFNPEAHAGEDGPEIPFDEETTYLESAHEAASEDEIEADEAESDEIELAEPDTFEFAGAPAGDSHDEAAEPAVAAAPVKAARKQAKRKPSALSNIIGSTVMTVIMLPFVYLVLLFIKGPDGDFLGIGPKLPGFIRPSSFNKTTQVAAMPSATDKKAPLKYPELSPGPSDTAKTPAAISPAPAPKAKEAAAAPAAANGDLAPLEKSELDDPSSSSADDSSLGGSALDPFAADGKPEQAEKEADSIKAKLGFGGVPTDGTEMPEEKAAGSPATEPEPAADEKPEEPGESVAEKPAELAEEPAVEEQEKTPAPTKTADAAAPATDDVFSDAAAPEPTAPKAAPPKPAPPKPAVGLRAPVTYSHDQLDQATADVQQAMAALATADGASAKELITLRSRLYIKFCALAQTATFLKADADQASAAATAVDNLAQKFAGAPGQFDTIGRGAAKWLKVAKRRSEGVLLPGTVKSVAKNGDLYETQVALSDGSVVPAVSSFKSDYDVGSRVIVVGSIVQDPAEKLIGYMGNEPMVVWMGLITSPPAITPDDASGK